MSFIWYIWILQAISILVGGINAVITGLNLIAIFAAVRNPQLANGGSGKKLTIDFLKSLEVTVFMLAWVTLTYGKL